MCLVFLVGSLAIRDGNPSVAQMVAMEAKMHQHHLCSREKVEQSRSSLVPSEQFTLGQQLLEQHPVIYLLYLLLNQFSEKMLFLVSYPTPLSHSRNHESENFSFSGDPRENERSRLIRAMVPVLLGGSDTSDQILTGLSGDEEVDPFFALYREAGIALGVDLDGQDPHLLDHRLVHHVLANSQGEFGISQDPISPGSVRFLLQRTATSPGSGDRLLLQPQLVPKQLVDSDLIREARSKFQLLGVSALGTRFAKGIPPNHLADLPSRHHRRCQRPSS